MIGVVVWSDNALCKAVIWCEDQGDLAFHKQDVATCKKGLQLGDWVEFDLKLQGNLRQAEGLKVLNEAASPGLAGQLVSALQDGQAAGLQNGGSGGKRQEAKIIPFQPRRRDTRCEPASCRNGSG